MEVIYNIEYDVIIFKNVINILKPTNRFSKFESISAKI